jgi:glycerol-3-phosphate cytidylyltransferase
MKSDTKGLVAGAFDVIHPGYIMMLKEASSVCDHLVVALHRDPSLERPQKLKPVLSVEDRQLVLESIRYIDEVVMYSTESELANLLNDLSIDIRILGEDYRGKHYTGLDTIPVYFCARTHGWSATKFKRKIKLQK